MIPLDYAITGFETPRDKAGSAFYFVKRYKSEIYSSLYEMIEAQIRHIEGHKDYVINMKKGEVSSDRITLTFDELEASFHNLFALSACFDWCFTFLRDQLAPKDIEK